MFLNCRLFLNDVHLAWLMSCTAQGLNEPRRKDTKFRALATDGSAVLHQLVCTPYCPLLRGKPLPTPSGFPGHGLWHFSVFECILERG